jgi:hypothetical protein
MLHLRNLTFLLPIAALFYIASRCRYLVDIHQPIRECCAMKIRVEIDEGLLGAIDRASSVQRTSRTPHSEKLSRHGWPVSPHQTGAP